MYRLAYSAILPRDPGSSVERDLVHFQVTRMTAHAKSDLVD